MAKYYLFSFQISVPKFRAGYVMRNIKNVWYPLCSPIGTKVNSSSLMALAVNICQLTVGSAKGYAFFFKQIHIFRSAI